MAGALQPYFGKLDACLAEKNAVTDLLNQVEEKTGLAKRNIVLGLVGLTAIWLAIGIGSNLVCSVVCFVYPAYKSFKAVESPEGDDDRQWLTYWIVYSSFNIVEYAADLILFWIPCYNLLKCAFLIWCMWPIPKNGSVLVYNHVLRPWLLKNEAKIDSRLENVTGKVNKYVDDARKEADSFTNSAAGQMLSSTAQVAAQQANEVVDEAFVDKDKEI